MVANWHGDRGTLGFHDYGRLWLQDGNAAVDIRTGVLDNSRNGGIGSNAGITLVAARLDNGQQGRSRLAAASPTYSSLKS